MNSVRAPGVSFSLCGVVPKAGLYHVCGLSFRSRHTPTHPTQPQPCSAASVGPVTCVSVTARGQNCRAVLGGLGRYARHIPWKSKHSCVCTRAAHNLFQCWEAEGSEGGQSRLFLGRPQDETAAGGSRGLGWGQGKKPAVTVSWQT